jgi:hypothetical protein
MNSKYKTGVEETAAHHAPPHATIAFCFKGCARLSSGALALSLRTVTSLVTATFLWFLGVGALEAQTLQNATNLPTTASFLLNAPDIAKAVFEKEDLNISEDVPMDQRSHRYLLKCDATNNFLGTLKGENEASLQVANGQFKGAYWCYFKGVLTFQDPKINTGPIRQGGGAAKLNIHLLANLGFPALSRTNRVLDASQQQIHANLEDGTPVVLQLKYDQDRITNAILSNAASHIQLAQVQYRYDGSFAGGRLPIGFTRSLMTPAGTFRDNCTVRFFELELTNQSLPEPEINPNSLFHIEQGKTSIHFLSNNIPYEILGGGKAMPIPITTQ